jgi:hypothetical protein
MRKFSNRFWLITWPVVVAMIHLGLLAGSIAKKEALRKLPERLN